MAPLTRGLMAFIAWSVTTAVLAPICFFVAVVLAGPHSSMLPSFMQPPVLVLAWLVLLVAPILIATRVWRRTGRAT